MTEFKSPSYLDTLALAYHVAGQDAKAIETERKALALFPEKGWLRAEVEEHLAEFEASLRNGKR